ncbi:Hsp20/alpha crystallin family protein [Planococcus salinus]|nr:Hsp20/alpha crystallin family protein [Planococcus salinus]
MKRLLPRRRDEFFPSLFESNMETDFFNKFFKAARFPQVDIKEKEKHYEFDVELPGFSKDDIQVEYKDGYLEIQGQKEHSYETEGKEGHYIRKERSYGSFKRVFYVGEINQEDISGSFTNGVLTLQVPKSEEDQKEERGHQIRIE